MDDDAALRMHADGIQAGHLASTYCTYWEPQQSRINWIDALMLIKIPCEYPSPPHELFELLSSVLQLMEVLLSIDNYQFR